MIQFIEQHFTIIYCIGLVVSLLISGFWLYLDKHNEKSDYVKQNNIEFSLMLIVFWPIVIILFICALIFVGIVSFLRMVMQYFLSILVNVFEFLFGKAK